MIEDTGTKRCRFLNTPNENNHLDQLAFLKNDKVPIVLPMYVYNGIFFQQYET